MARNGSGTYFLPPSNPVVSGTVIESDWANDTMADIAAALSQSMAYDGQTVPIANLQMGGFHHTNVSDPTSRNQYVTLGMAQDYRVSRINGLTGVDNLVGTLIGGATAYMAGALVNFFAPATNTGAMTLNYNGIGARSLTDADGLAIAPGAIQAGQFVIAVYTGTEFRLLSQVDAAVAADLYNLSITGQIRPPSDVYPSLTIATASSVNIPAGEAWINPPGNDPDDAVKVTWPAQTLILQFLASSFTTFIMVDSTGSLQQIPGRAIGANFRSMALIGVVEHITGVVNNVITRPSIFGDDGYRARDQASLLANTIANGGLVTPNAVSTLNLDVAQGTIFIPGGSANSVDSPNTFNIPPQSNIQFRTLAGQNTLSGLVSNVPVANYDLNGAGVVAALPSPGDATIHRLYYLYGQYVLAYGQQAYTSVENAMSMIAWDRTKYRKSLYLADATLMAEIVAVRTATNLNILTQGAIVCPGGINFSIGSPGGIAEAPIDGLPYGRRNAAWFQVLASVSPMITIDATITGVAPMLKEVVSPADTAGTSGRTVYNAANRWYATETVAPDDKTYFRSYNPASGALRHTTTYDLATGGWQYPSSVGVETSLNMTGPTSRITGDFSNVTLLNRTLFQNRVADAPSTIGVIPSGTATSAFFAAYGKSDPTNSSMLQLSVTDGVSTAILSSRQGTGNSMPLIIATGNSGGADRMRFDGLTPRIAMGGAAFQPWSGVGTTIDFSTGSLYNSTSLDNLYYDGTNFRRRVLGGGSFYQQGGGNHIFYGFPSAAANAIADTNQGPIFYIAGSVPLASRGVGVNTTTINAKLSVVCNYATHAGLRINGESSGDTTFPIQILQKVDNNNTTSQVFIHFVINNGAIGQGQINGNGAGLAAFGAFSDIRLKKNVVDLPPQLANIMALRPVEFDYKSGGHQIGFIAQEHMKVFPDSVTEGEDGMLMLTAWAKTEAILVKAIQDQQGIINSLTERLEALEAKLSRLGM